MKDRQASFSRIRAKVPSARRWSLAFPSKLPSSSRAIWATSAKIPLPSSCTSSSRVPGCSAGSDLDELVAEAQASADDVGRLDGTTDGFLELRQAPDPHLQRTVVVAQEVGRFDVKIRLQRLELLGQGFRVLLGHGEPAEEPGADPQAGPLGSLLDAVERLQGVGIANALGAERHQILWRDLAVERGSGPRDGASCARSRWRWRA